MDKEQIESDLKHLSYGIQYHQEEVDHHQGVIDKQLEATKRLQAQLARAEEPEIQPKHLDYGLYQFGEYEPTEAVYINIPGAAFSDLIFYFDRSEGKAIFASRALENGKFLAIHGNLADEHKAEQEKA